MSSELESQKLLGEFDPASYDNWRTLVEEQLKGAPFEKKLVTKSLEGITVQPIYTRLDPSQNKITVPLPGQFPYTRSTTAEGKTRIGWRILETVQATTAKELESFVAASKGSGIDGVSIKLSDTARNGDTLNSTSDPNDPNGLVLNHLEDLKQAFSGLDFSNCYLQIDSGLSGLPLFALLRTFMGNTERLKGELINDPIAVLAESGRMNRSLDTIYSELGLLIKWTAKDSPNFQALGIDGRPVKESGGSIVQEIAVVLSSAAESIRQLMEKGLAIDEIAKAMTIHLATGADFFLEMAKIRSIRSLWAEMMNAFGASEESQKAKISIHEASFNKTLLDPHVNILRSTTEAFSAVLSGAETISVNPYNQLSQTNDTLARRIARNIQIILKEECHGNHVTDPAGGAWYIETVTGQLSESAWKLFQEIEGMGGVLKAFETGSIQGKITETWRARQAALARRKNVIVGTNMYANIQEVIPEVDHTVYKKTVSKLRQELATFKDNRAGADFSTPLIVDNLADDDQLVSFQAACIAAFKNGWTLEEFQSAQANSEDGSINITPLQQKRVASAYEELRKAAEKYEKVNGHRPLIYLANIGLLRDCKARADFSTAFLEPGGFEVIGGKDALTVAEVVSGVTSSSANIIVMCSTDDRYAEQAKEVAIEIRKIKPEAKLILAGYPKDLLEELNQSGVDDYLHLKANNLSLLTKLHETIGV